MLVCAPDFNAPCLVWTCLIKMCLHGLIAWLLRTPSYLRSHQCFNVVAWSSGVPLCESCISIFSEEAGAERDGCPDFYTALARTQLKVPYSNGCRNCGLHDMVKIFKSRSAKAKHSLSANLMHRRGFKSSPESWAVLQPNHLWPTDTAWPGKAEGSLHHSSETNSHVFIWKSSCSVSIAICHVP